MTLSTSAVAVCCCSDLRSSLSRRVFSMAMTAWRGEVRDQLDLLVGEWPHLLAIDGDRADQLVLLEHRDDEDRAGAGEIDRATSRWIAFKIWRHGSDVSRCAPPASSCDYAPGALSGWLETARSRARTRRSCRRYVVHRSNRENAPRRRGQYAELGLAEPRRILQHGVEHRLQLAGRARDDLSTSEVAVCCSSDSLSSRVRACTSSNSRTFSIAITAWSAKVVTSSICLSRERPHRLARTAQSRRSEFLPAAAARRAGADRRQLPSGSNVYSGSV